MNKKVDRLWFYGTVFFSFSPIDFQSRLQIEWPIISRKKTFKNVLIPWLYIGLICDG